MTESEQYELMGLAFAVGRLTMALRVAEAALEEERAECPPAS